MKRITFWFLSTLSVVVLLFGYDGSRSGTTSTALPPAVVPGGTAASGRTTTSNAPASASGSATSSKSGTAKRTRTVDGGVASTQWGPVQVELTVRGRTITGVRLLQQPSGNPRDDEINSFAVPILMKETTASQSATIDMVSGATVTSTGYIQSLQSAIDQAGL
jgi:uncharacterized protein with FMN-binding domain